MVAGAGEDFKQKVRGGEKAGCRQGKATLLQLLRFDPARRRPGEAGYGAGSGAPEVMLGYLKHLWYTGADRVDVLNRHCTACLSRMLPDTCTCIFACLQGSG